MRDNRHLMIMTKKWAYNQVNINSIVFCSPPLPKIQDGGQRRTEAHRKLLEHSKLKI